jgi:GAF domain-containing protein
LDGLLSVRSREQVYDAVVIPALTLIEESRHGEEITASRAEEMLHAIDELTEDMASRESVSGSSGSTTPKLIICIPARDLADEVVCHFATHILTPAATVHVVPAETAPSAIAEMIERLHPDAICIVGIPPQSLRYIRLRCHQVRSRFPDAVLFACLLSEQCDLSNIRSRIPTEHSQHVVCSLQLMKEYLLSLLYSTALEVDATRESGGATDAKEDLTDPVLAMQRAGAIDETEEGAFQRLTTNLARSFDAPISILSTSNNNRSFWEAYCGLPNDALLGSDASHDPSILTRMIMSESILVVPDISEDPLYIHEPFLSERGIRFYAGTPIKSHDDAVIGSLCVLDTRPRQITEKQKEMLLWIAEVVMTAIELQKTTAPIDTSLVDTELSRVEG